MVRAQRQSRRGGPGSFPLRLCRAARTAVVLAALVVSTIAPVAADGDRLYAVDVAKGGPELVVALTSDRGARWWIELGDVLVVSGSSRARGRAAARARVRDLDAPRAGERLYVTRLVHPNHILWPTHAETRLLASSGLYALVAATPDAARDLESHGHGEVSPARPGTVYARSPAPRASTARAALGAAAATVDVERWHDTVADLAAFGTRHVGTDGARAARDYIAAEFERIGLDVSVETVTAAGSTAWNVVGEIGGDLEGDDIYIVCGHYDSTSERPQSLAPGAEDNGSGAAGVLELARVFAQRPPAARVRFIAFSGEEVGLVGSRRYVEALERSGEAERVKGVINMDMIGYSSDDDLDVLLETSQVGVPIADALAEAAAPTSLRVVRSLNPFGSDHVPFLQNGIPCVLTIENDWDEYDAYHTSRDTIDNVRRDMGGEILKMNAGAIEALAGDASLGASVRLAGPIGGQTLHGGFVETIHWTSAGDSIASFDLELSVDGGTTFEPIATGIAGEALRYDWAVPEALEAEEGRLRIVARTTVGEAVTDTADGSFAIRPSSGPSIKKVRFKGDRLVVTGRLAHTYSKVFVDDVELEVTFAMGRFDGNTTKRLFGSDSRLDALVPRGVPVRVRVVDLRNGQSTAEITFTR